MHKVLIVIDVQVDFVDGALGTKEAQAMLPYLVNKLQTFSGEILFTQDTHHPDYLSTIEGKKLPVMHCLEGTKGWAFHPTITAFTRQRQVFKKPTFGSLALVEYLINLNHRNPIDQIIFVGLCTDICVLSNVTLVKAALPNVNLIVDSHACAGVTPHSHQRALEAMQMIHIEIQ